MLRKAFSLVSPAGPTMIGAKGREKFLNSKGSRSSENAMFFEYFYELFCKDFTIKCQFVRQKSKHLEFMSHQVVF